MANTPAPPSPRKVVAVVGDGVNVLQTITHNLGTRDVAGVLCVSAVSPYNVLVPVTLAFPSVNTLNVTFASVPALNGVRVVVTA